MNQGGPEGQPQGQDRAIIERERGELVVPQILPGDLITLHEARTGVLPAIETNITERVNAAFTAELERFEEGVRLKKRKGLLGRGFYINREAIIQGGELFGRLREERSQLSVTQTLKELRGTLGAVVKAAEEVHEENRIFLRYFFPTLITESTADDVWEAVLPREDILEVLGGLLLRSKRTVPFRAHGKRHQHSESEDMKLAGPFLPPEMLKELVENVSLPAMNMSKNLRKVVELVSLFGEPEMIKETERGELKDASHLEFDVRAFNFCLLRMLEDPSHPQAGIFSILMATAFAKIKKQLEEDINKGGYFRSAGLIPRINRMLETPHGSFFGYLKDGGYSDEDRQYIKDEETGRYWPPYVVRKI